MYNPTLYFFTSPRPGHPGKDKMAWWCDWFFGCGFASTRSPIARQVQAHSDFVFCSLSPAPAARARNRDYAALLRKMVWSSRVLPNIVPEGEWGQGSSSPRIGIRLTNSKPRKEASSYLFSSPRPACCHQMTRPQTVTVPGWSVPSKHV